MQVGVDELETQERRVENACLAKHNVTDRTIRVCTTSFPLRVYKVQFIAKKELPNAARESIN